MGTIRTLGPLFAPSFHRPWLRYIDAVDGAEGSDGGDGDGSNEQTFTQADIDRIVKERVTRERAKFADYDDLKAKAAGAKMLEQQFADMQNELATTKADAIRSRIAAEHGISTKKGPNGEPSDADLFLTGTTEETLSAQAARLSDRTAEQKRNGGVVRREGGNRNTNGKDSDMREVVRGLFGNDND